MQPFRVLERTRRLADAKIDASYQMLSSGRTGEDRVVVSARTLAHENHLEVCAAMLYFGDEPFKYRRLLGDCNSLSIAHRGQPIAAALGREPTPASGGPSLAQSESAFGAPKRLCETPPLLAQRGIAFR